MYMSQGSHEDAMNLIYCVLLYIKFYWKAKYEMLKLMIKKKKKISNQTEESGEYLDFWSYRDFDWSPREKKMQHEKKKIRIAWD